ncbi:sodium:solute symporter family protein [Fusobacterium perfoetens]|uniref:sodium:solute symporter family protein n=1 Tax=Fusobacterium perfoetens TaxID=852 RepID=UPI001F1B7EAC|nr:sodium:solute symporter family protein [Fusobacterium perfoetens]MCF2625725.1 sodium:solute symporter family protein [Fusobacterium perfoetens]
MNELILFFYFFIVIIIGILSFKKVKNNSDFFVAGKKAGVLQVSGSLLASILGSSAIIGSVDFAYISGWAGSSLMLCAAFGLILLYPLTNYIKNFKGYNLPNMLGNFYGEEVQKISSLLIPVAWLGVIASQIMGAAKIITILSSFTYTQGVCISGAVFIFYTILGGQLSIIKTDFVQLIFILLGIILTFSYIAPEPISETVPQFINENFTYLDLFIMILTYSTTYLVGPDIYSRLFCSKNEKVMKNSIIVSVCFLIPLAYIFARIGIYGSQIFESSQVGKESVLLMIADKKLPHFISFSLYFGLLSAVISSADTTLLTASSLAAQVFLEDLKSKKAIFITRILTIILGIAAVIISLKMKYILSTLLLALAVYSGAFIIPVLVGIFGFRTRKEVVISAIILGGITALIGKLYGGDIGNFLAAGAFLINGGILYLGNKLK